MAPRLFLPKGIAHWAEGRTWLHVRYSSRPRLADDAWEVPIEIHKGPNRGDSKEFVAALVKKAGKKTRAIQMVAASYLSRQLRATLEAEGIGYLDAWGRLHLPWADGLVHVETDRKGLASRRTPSATLGVHGVRAVQAILEQPTNIQVKSLAKQTKLSLSGTHTVLTILEGAGLVRATGSGPAKRRTVVDRTRLLEWLAAQPAARRRERHVDVAFYARTVVDGWLRLRRALDRAHIDHALTGSAAAMALGAGPTNLSMTAVRISPDTPLEDVVTALRAEETERGANLRLVRDTGSVGTIAALDRNDVLVAPLARIYLDTLAERRGEDIAEHFREVVLGY